MPLPSGLGIFPKFKTMQKFKLELLFQIIGIGSASGLVFKDNSLYIISDNSGFLYEYAIEKTELKKHPLIENPSENIPKKIKPDFESITFHNNNLYLFGSGSTENRNKMVRFEQGTNSVSATKDLADLYLSMQSFGNINPEDFNIEGAIYDGNRWFLLNRGNGISNKNTVFTVEGKNISADFSLLSNDFELPKINNIATSFTDAVLVDNKIYFLATAENTTSTYLDGEVLGSIIGCIDIDKMTIDFTKKISDTHKFEGITLFKKLDNQLEFLLCEDNDTETLQSNIYRLEISK